MFSNYEVEMLFRLRSRNIDVKSNFKSKYEQNDSQNLQSRMDNCFDIENQPHILNCKPLLTKLSKSIDRQNISYNDLFAKTKKQKKVVELFIALLDTRNLILEKKEQSN